MEYNDLYNWTTAHNVKEETENGFLEMIDNLKRDSPHKITKHFGENFNPSLLRVTFYKVALTVRFDIEPTLNYIASYARAEYGNEDIGVYKLIFNCNGEIEDDYWLLNDD